MLAFMSDSRVNEIIQCHGLPAATENTITDSDTLSDELAKIREQGYATNRSESTKIIRRLGSRYDRSGGGYRYMYRFWTDASYERRGKTSKVIEILRSVVNDIELNLAHS